MQSQEKVDTLVTEYNEQMKQLHTLKKNQEEIRSSISFAKRKEASKNRKLFHDKSESNILDTHAAIEIGPLDQNEDAAYVGIPNILSLNNVADRTLDQTIDVKD